MEIKYPGGDKFVGPFLNRDELEAWATKNVDARIYPYRVHTLIIPE
jgi:hypothetical protein